MFKKSGWIIGFVGIIVISFYGTKAMIGNGDTGHAANVSRLPDTIPAQFVPTWTYRNNPDEMRGTITHNAIIESNDEYTNTLGDNPIRTKLFIRKDGQKLDIFVLNENLQYQCSSHSYTYFSLKFDDGPVTKYQCGTSANSTYGMAFISKEPLVLDKIRSSKILIIETPVYQRGNIQQTFVIEGLNWDQFNR